MQFIFLSHLIAILKMGHVPLLWMWQRELLVCWNLIGLSFLEIAKKIPSAMTDGKGVGWGNRREGSNPSFSARNEAIFERKLPRIYICSEGDLWCDGNLNGDG